MRRTLGYHYVKTAYGLWLPGDERGHWSEAWDQQIGFVEPHTLHEADPTRLRMAKQRMKHKPVHWSPTIIDAIAHAITHCESNSSWTIAAASIEATHLHLLINYTPLDINRTAKWLSQQMTKTVHQKTKHTGPVFAQGNWIGFIYEPAHWQTTKRYIERHNQRLHQPPQPYPFITP